MIGQQLLQQARTWFIPAVESTLTVSAEKGDISRYDTADTMASPNPTTTRTLRSTINVRAPIIKFLRSKSTHSNHQIPGR